MKTVVLLMSVGLVVDTSYALLFSEGKNRPSEDENRLTREASHRTGALRHTWSNYLNS